MQIVRVNAPYSVLFIYRTPLQPSSETQGNFPLTFHRREKQFFSSEENASGSPRMQYNGVHLLHFREAVKCFVHTNSQSLKMQHVLTVEKHSVISI